MMDLYILKIYSSLTFLFSIWSFMVVETDITFNHLQQFIICLQKFMDFTVLTFQMSEKVLTLRIVIAVCFTGMGDGNTIQVKILDI